MKVSLGGAIDDAIGARIGAGAPPATGALVAHVVQRAPADVGEALDVAVELGGMNPVQGRDLWEALATVASADLGIARAMEPHLDAVIILAEAGEPVPLGSWGVFAAEGGDEPLRASADGDAWLLTGVKPWCSLAATLDSALVTAPDRDGNRRLFAVDLLEPGVRVDTDGWQARGLTEIPSTPVRFEQVRARTVGDPGWYLARPGFSWGGVAVAACWFGGAVGIGRTVYERARTNPDAHLLAHLGAIDEQLESARRVLLEASDLVGDDASNARLTAKRVRATVARACEEVLWRASHALGPAPLAMDATHAKRVADLQLYIRQHHAERDLASLGVALAEGPTPW